METYFDEAFEEYLDNKTIMGGIVSVVQDGEKILSKGYGSANLEKGIPVDVEETLFRVGSIGKIFTATAVMQLVEQGKLDLHRNIEDYIDFTSSLNIALPNEDTRETLLLY